MRIKTMGTNYYAISKKATHSKSLHIGKASVDWKFLFYKLEDYENYDNFKNKNNKNKGEILWKLIKFRKMRRKFRKKR